MQYLGLYPSQLEDIDFVIEYVEEQYDIHSDNIYEYAMDLLKLAHIGEVMLGNTIVEAFFLAIAKELERLGIDYDYFVNGDLDTSFTIFENGEETRIV